MVVAIFGSRIREEKAQEYVRLAEQVPGFISYKAYTAADGERVSRYRSAIERS
ncbi:MAG: hypothetical protein R3286_15345 [Gammaproteobacteria bacterium]|nr:hypothetical protein [Gammaproteobacteria bacterium]